MKKRINSREKGKAGERDFRNMLRRMGFTARRGEQYAGGTDSPDVLCDQLPHIHFEVKFGNKFAIGTKPVLSAWKQACEDAGDKKVPVVAFRRNNEPWKVMHLDEDGALVLLWHPPDIKFRMGMLNERMGKEVGPKE